MDGNGGKRAGYGMAEESEIENHPSASRQVARGTLILTAFQFASKPLFAIYFILLGNRALFPSESYGRLETLLALVNTFLIFSDCGLETYTTRGIARDPASTKSWLPGQLTLKAVLTLISTTGLLIWLVGTSLARGEGLDFGVWLATGILLIALSAQSYLRAVSRGHYRMDVEGKMGVIEKAVTLGVGCLVLFTFANLTCVAAAFAFGGLSAATYALLVTKRFENGLQLGFPVSWHTLKNSFPFALSSLCIGLFFNIDRIFLSFWSDSWVASYSRGLRLVLALLLFPQMLSIAVYPTLSRLKDHSLERLHVSRRALQGILLIALPCTTGTFVLAGPLMDLLYGADGSASTRMWAGWLGADSSLGNQTEAACLRILILGLPFTCGNYLFGPALNALDRETWNLKASAFTLGISWILQIFLIFFFGPAGAALATTLTQAFYCFCLYWFLRKEDPSWFAGTRWKTIAGTSLAMALLLTPLCGLSVLIQAGIGGLIYGFTIWVMGLWPNLLKVRKN